MRGSYLVQSDFDRLEDWCRLVRVIFQGANPYLVGSATQRPDYRDVDIRVILTDSTFDLYQRTRPERIRYLNRAISVWGQQETGLPIDFQVQRATEANAEFTGTRNPMGTRDWALIPTSGVPAATPAPSAGRLPCTNCGCDDEDCALHLRTSGRPCCPRCHIDHAATPAQPEPDGEGER